MSFRRRMVLLAAGAVAAAVVLASVVVYVVTRDELRSGIDNTLRAKVTPGLPQAVQLLAKAELERTSQAETGRPAGAGSRRPRPHRWRQQALGRRGRIAGSATEPERLGQAPWSRKPSRSKAARS